MQMTFQYQERNYIAVELRNTKTQTKWKQLNSNGLMKPNGKH